MIDEWTMRAYKACEEAARKSGRPLVEVLDEVGLLATASHDGVRRRIAVQHIVSHIQEKGPVGFLGVSYYSGRHTALEMYNGILKWLREEVLREPTGEPVDRDC